MPECDHIWFLREQSTRRTVMVPLPPENKGNYTTVKPTDYNWYCMRCRIFETTTNEEEVVKQALWKFYERNPEYST